MVTSAIYLVAWQMKVRIQIITFQGMLIWFEFCMFKNKLLDTTTLKRNILGRLPSVPSTHIWIVQWMGYMQKSLNISSANPRICNTD